MNNLQNGTVVGCLQDDSGWGSHSLVTIPLLLGRVLRENMWQEFYIEVTNKTQRYAEGEFEKFVTTPLPEGLGMKPDFFRKIIRDDIELLVLFDSAMGSPEAEPMDTFKNLLAAKALSDQNLLRHVEQMVRRKSWNPTGEYSSLESMLQAEHGLNFGKLSQAFWRELSRQNIKSQGKKLKRRRKAEKQLQMTFAGLAAEAESGSDYYDE